MRTTAIAISAAVLLGGAALGLATPASAASVTINFGHRPHLTFCDIHPYNLNCRVHPRVLQSFPYHPWIGHHQFEHRFDHRWDNHPDHAY